MDCMRRGAKTGKSKQLFSVVLVPPGFDALCCVGGQVYWYASQKTLPRGCHEQCSHNASELCTGRFFVDLCFVLVRGVVRFAQLASRFKSSSLWVANRASVASFFEQFILIKHGAMIWVALMQDII